LIQRKDEKFRVKTQIIYADSCTKKVTYAYNGDYYKINSSTITISDCTSTQKIINLNFDDTGLCTSKVIKNQSGTEIRKTLYEYNDNREIKKEDIYHNGTFMYPLYYNRDDWGNLVYIKDGEGYEYYSSFVNTNYENKFVNYNGNEVSLFTPGAFYNNSSVDPDTHSLCVGEAYLNNGRKIETYYQYNAEGNLTQSKQKHNSSWIYTTNAYDSYGNITSTTDDKGNTVSYQYDADHLYLTKIQKPIGEINMSYDVYGNLMSLTDERGYTYTYDYDLINRVTKVTNPDLTYKTASYDDTNNKVTITDENGNTATKYFDGLGRLIKEEHPYGFKEYTYYYNGKLKTAKDELSHITLYEYDTLGRTTKVINPDNTEKEYIYDDITNKITFFDENNHKKEYYYDKNQRLIKVKEFTATTYITEYTYDAKNLIQIRDTQNNTKNFNYDDLERLTGITYPDSTTEFFTYDTVGNLTQKTDQNGVNISYQYDSNYRLTLIDYPTGTDVSYEYDLHGNVTKVVDGTETQYTYDNRNRMTGKTRIIDGVSYPLNYSYDDVSNLTSLGYPDSFSLYYNYDPLNRITDMGYGTTTYASFGYNNVSRVTSITYGNSITTNFSYDNRNRITNIAIGSHLSLNYTYDNVGNIITLNDVNYQYDELDRLIHVQEGNNSTDYEYDPLGNRVEKIESTGGDPPQNWMDSSWTRRKPITITNNSGNTLTNYQIKLTVSYDSDMQPDFDDLRFTNSDGMTQLNYWIESYTASSSATVWLKIPSLPISGKTIYMYYGNAAAADASNGNAVFDFFDDFEGTSIDTTKWQVDTSSYSVSNSILRINVGAVSVKDALSFNLNDGYILEGKIQYHDTINAYSGTLSAQSSHYTQGSNSGADATNLCMRNKNLNVHRWTGDGSVSGYNQGHSNVFTSDNNTWYILGAKFYSGGLKLTKNRTEMESYSFSWNKNIEYISIGAFHGSSTYNVQDTSYDWVLIRKYTFTEPTATFGAEEKIDGAGSTTDTVYYDYDIYNLTEERYGESSGTSYIDEWVWEEGEYDPNLITIVHDEMDGISLNPERTANHVYKIDDVDSQAYWGGSTRTTGFDYITKEFSATWYNRIKNDDEVCVNTSSNWNQYAMHRFDTTIDENVSDVTQIVVTIRGYGEMYYPNKYYALYVKQSGNWTFKASHTNGVKTTLTTTYTSGFSNVVSGGHFHWGVRTGRDSRCGAHIRSYYGEIVVAYVPSEATYISAPKYVGSNIISFDSYESIAELNGQTIDLYFRSSPDSETWSDWHADITQVPVQEWVQFKAVLKTNDPSVSPVLYNVTIIATVPGGNVTYTYSYDNNGNLISKTDGTDTYEYTYNYENMLTEVKKNEETIAQYFYTNGKRNNNLHLVRK